MTESNSPDDQGRAAIGQPPGDAADPDGDPDFANEHEETAVSDDVITGEGDDGESGSPEGWSGMEKDSSPLV